MSNWYYYERMADLKRQEIERGLEHARLLREARLAAGPSLLERVVEALRKLAKRQERGLASGQSIDSRVYRSASGKAA
jgi:hypothetical protein